MMDNMIVTDTWRMSVRLDVRYRADLAAHASLASSAARRLSEDLSLEFATDIAIPPGAMRVKVSEPHEQTMLCDAIISYSPDPALGVHLIGGPRDGEAFAFNAPGRVAPSQIRMPQMSRVPELVTADAPATLAAPLVYERHGIDVSTSTWVYKHRA